MFISIKDRMDEPEIQELLSYSVFPDPDHLEQAVRDYQEQDDLQLYGLESEEELVGLIGFRHMGDGEVKIEHISVKPERRGEEFGRGLVLELIAEVKPKKIIVETDEEAVEFYRRIGFEIQSLGEMYPGTERYRCTYDVVGDAE